MLSGSVGTALARSSVAVGGGNPADAAFINDQIGRFLAR